MALIWADGFDHYGSGSTGNTNMTTYGSYALSLGSPEVTNPRTGSYSYKCFATSIGWQTARLLNPANSHFTTIGVHMAFNITNVGSEDIGLFMLSNDENNGRFHIGVQVGSNGSVNVVKKEKTSSGGVSIGSTSSALISSNTWYGMSAWFVGSSSISASDGSAIVKITKPDGSVVVITLTNISTYNYEWFTGPYFCNITIGGINNLSSLMYIDDLAINDSTGSHNNSILDDQKCYLQTEGQDTSFAAWTPASGSGYSNISAVPKAPSTKYVSSSAVSDVSKYWGTAIASSLTNIAGVVQVTTASCSSTGAMTVGTESAGGGSTTGSAHTLTTTPQEYCDVFETNPATSAAWTAAGVTNRLVVLTRTA